MARATTAPGPWVPDASPPLGWRTDSLRSACRHVPMVKPRVRNIHLVAEASSPSGPERINVLSTVSIGMEVSTATISFGDCSRADHHRSWTVAKPTAAQTSRRPSQPRPRPASSSIGTRRPPSRHGAATAIPRRPSPSRLGSARLAPEARPRSRRTDRAPSTGRRRITDAGSAHCPDQSSVRIRSATATEAHPGPAQRRQTQHPVWGGTPPRPTPLKPARRLHSPVPSAKQGLALRYAECQQAETTRLSSRSGSPCSLPLGGSSPGSRECWPRGGNPPEPPCARLRGRR